MYDENLTGVPIQVGGVEAILIEDSVGSPELFNVPILLEEASGAHPAIWVDEPRISGLRAKYPGTPIYGLWQTLYQNNMVEGSGLEIVFTGETSGFFLLYENAEDEQGEDDKIWNGLHVESGEYLGDRIASHPALIPSRDGQIIRPEFGAMVLPDSPARLMSELLAERRARAKKLWIARGIVGGVAASIIAASYGVNALRDNVARGQVSSLTEEIRVAQEEIGRLETGRLAEWPKPFREIAPFVLLHAIDQDFIPADELKVFSLKETTNRAIISTNLHQEEIPAEFKKMRRPDGQWEVSW